MTPATFIAKWSRAMLSERSASQQHFIDLCRLLGQPTPAEHDATGAEYTFEKGVAVTDGASRGAKGDNGYADVWWKDKFAWEYKRKDKYKDLTDAYRQLCQYREALGNPPLLVVSDITRTEIHTNFTRTVPQVHTILLSEMDQPEKLSLLRRLFTNPDTFCPTVTPEKVTEEVAKNIASLARSLQGRGHEPHATAHFLMKCMFCLFAEDVSLLPDKLFSRLLTAWHDQPGELAARLTELFDKMRTGGAFGSERIAWFNGGLFDQSPALPLEYDEIGLLRIAAGQNWGSVEPAIFGTLFERSLDPTKRAQIGAHYTGRDDIMLIVEPVVMAPLRRQWQSVKDEVEKQVERRRAGKTKDTKKKADQAINDLLQGFLNHLAALRILDPACGSGNFLYVALQLLLDLEKEVITFAARPDIGLGLFPTVRPTQLHGIEINPYAAELAQVVIWIGYLQWMRDNGFNTPRDPILQPLQTIENRDAILDFSGEPRTEVSGLSVPRPEVSGLSGEPRTVVSGLSVPRPEVSGLSGEPRTVVSGLSVPRPEVSGLSGEPRTVVSGLSVPAIANRPEPLPSGRESERPLPSGRESERPLPSGRESERPLPPGRESERPLPSGRGSLDAANIPVPAKWPETDFIIGNPPFLGGSLIWEAFGTDYRDALWSVYDIPNFCDFCCYFFEQARKTIERKPDTRVGLLATQAIRGGANREVLERIKKTGDLFMAWSDRDWFLDGATVHVSMIGFDNGSQNERTLDGQPVTAINSNLTAGEDLTKARPLTSNLDLCLIGVKKAGGFDMSWPKARQMLLAPANPNGQRNTEVLRPVLNGVGMTRRTAAGWIVDFGVNMPMEAAAGYELPFKHAETSVFPERSQNKRKLYRERWWLYAETRPSMRKAQTASQRCLITAYVTKHRLFTWLDSRIIPADGLFLFARNDDYFFGVLHSSIHELWTRGTGTQLREAESGFRYTPTTCFETFPLPWPPGKESLDDPLHKAISDAAAELNEMRERWLNPPEWIEPIARAIDAADSFADVPAEARALVRQSAIMAAAAKDANLKRRTLTNLYNERPTWLRLAHLKLDQAVLAAYAAVDPEGGWSPTWAEVWQDTGAGKKGTDTDFANSREIGVSPHFSGRAEIDQKVLANLLRMNLARAGE